MLFIYRTIIITILILGITGCQKTWTDPPAQPAPTWSQTEQKLLPSAVVRKSIHQMNQAGTVRFVIKSESHDKETGAFFYTGMMNKDTVTLTGKVGQQQVTVYQKEDKTILENGNSYKILQPNQVGIVSPRHHLQLIENNINKATRITKPVFIDHVKYDHFFIPVPKNEVKKIIQQFLGPQFSDKITLNQVAKQAHVQYHLAIHPVQTHLKQIRLSIQITMDETKVEDNIYFRFIDTEIKNEGKP